MKRQNWLLAKSQLPFIEDKLDCEKFDEYFNSVDVDGSQTISFSEARNGIVRNSPLVKKFFQSELFKQVMDKFWTDENELSKDRFKGYLIYIYNYLNAVTQLPSYETIADNKFISQIYHSDFVKIKTVHEIDMDKTFEELKEKQGYILTDKYLDKLQPLSCWEPGRNLVAAKKVFMKDQFEKNHSSISSIYKPRSLKYQQKTEIFPKEILESKLEKQQIINEELRSNIEALRIQMKIVNAKEFNDYEYKKAQKKQQIIGKEFVPNQIAIDIDKKLKKQ